MKKVLLGALFCAFGTFAFGQRVYTPIEGQKGFIVDPLVKKNVLDHQSKSAKKDEVAGWYNYVDATLKLEVIEYQFFNNSYIFPDSTVKQTWGDGSGGTYLGSVTTNGVGQVLDPKSAYFDDDELGTKPLSKYNKYHWDSVALFYQNYRYNVPGSVDTLIFQFYTSKNNGIQSADLTTGDKTPIIRYNYKTNLGIGNISTYKYLLTEKDTATNRLTVITVPVNTTGGLDVAANSLVGYTVSYRPGYQYNVGDTLDASWDKPVPTKKLNSLRLMVGQDAAKSEWESFNIGQRLISATRYNLTGNGWNGAYIPGNAWNAINEYVYSSFYITAGSVSVEENGPFKGYGVGNIYPNPATGTANLQFELGKSENVTIEVYNMLGQKVTSVVNANYAAGKHNVNFSVENLQSGVYMCNINAGGFTKTMKFTVTK